MALPRRSSGRGATREPREERPGRPERVSRNAPHPLRWRFSGVSSRPRPSRPFPGLRRLASDAGQRLWMSITGSLSIRRLKDCPVVMDLHELSPVDRRATGGRDGRRLERFAKMREDFPDRPRLRDERDQPDVAAARWALERKLLPQPGPSVSPTQSVRCRASGAFGSRESRRSSLLRHAYCLHPRRQRPLAACRCSRSPAP